jgi:hypothetical protein
MLASYYTDDGDNEISYDEFKLIIKKLFSTLQYDGDDDAKEKNGENEEEEGEMFFDK